MATTNGLPYPALSDAPNLPSAVQALAEGVDSRYGLVVANAAALAAVTSPYKGMRVFLDDTDQVSTYNGAAWTGHSETYVPTWSAATTPPTLGASTLAGRFVRDISDMVDFEIEVNVGAGGFAAGTGFYTWTLPTAAHADLDTHAPIGLGTFFDTSASTVFGRRATLNSSTTLILRDEGGTAVGAAAPAAPATGDKYLIQGRYRAA